MKAYSNQDNQQPPASNIQSMQSWQPQQIQIQGAPPQVMQAHYQNQAQTLPPYQQVNSSLSTHPNAPQPYYPNNFLDQRSFALLHSKKKVQRISKC